MCAAGLVVAPPKPLTADGFRDVSNVSRETLDRLQAYLDLLIHWQRRINLVGPSSLADPWRRHFLDSWQLLRHIPDDAKTLADLGSGAGFPGLVLSILGVPGVHLVDSDERKGVFLREAIRITGATAQVITARIEDFPHGFPADFRADVVTSRALAPLSDLLALSRPILSTYGVCLFMKGRNVEQELTESAKNWNINLKRIPSQTDSAAALLKIQGFQAVDEREP